LEWNERGVGDKVLLLAPIKMILKMLWRSLISVQIDCVQQELPEWCGQAVVKRVLGLFEGDKSEEMMYHNKHVPGKTEGTW
jgi:hypothetical protein